MSCLAIFYSTKRKNRAKCKTCGKELVFQYVGSRGGGGGGVAKPFLLTPEGGGSFFCLKFLAEWKEETGSNQFQPGINTVTGGILYYDPKKDREELAKNGYCYVLTL